MSEVEFEREQWIPTPEEMCELAGHEWAPMGGGMFVCMVCEIESDEDDGAEDAWENEGGR